MRKAEKRGGGGRKGREERENVGIREETREIVKRGREGQKRRVKRKGMGKWGEGEGGEGGGKRVKMVGEGEKVS